MEEGDVEDYLGGGEACVGGKSVCKVLYFPTRTEDNGGQCIWNMQAL